MSVSISILGVYPTPFTLSFVLHDQCFLFSVFHLYSSIQLFSVVLTLQEKSIPEYSGHKAVGPSTWGANPSQGTITSHSAHNFRNASQPTPHVFGLRRKPLYPEETPRAQEKHVAQIYSR